MKCPECGGVGEVFWDYDDPELECVVEAHDTCPMCHGTGIINDGDSHQLEKFVEEKKGIFILNGDIYEEGNPLNLLLYKQHEQEYKGDWSKDE